MGIKNSPRSPKPSKDFESKNRELELQFLERNLKLLLVLIKKLMLKIWSFELDDNALLESKITKKIEVTLQSIVADQEIYGERTSCEKALLLSKMLLEQVLNDKNLSDLEGSKKDQNGLQQSQSADQLKDL